MLWLSPRLELLAVPSPIDHCQRVGADPTSDAFRLAPDLYAPCPLVEDGRAWQGRTGHELRTSTVAPAHLREPCFDFDLCLGRAVGRGGGKPSTNISANRSDRVHDCTD